MKKAIIEQIEYSISLGEDPEFHKEHRFTESRIRKCLVYVKREYKMIKVIKNSKNIKDSTIVNMYSERVLDSVYRIDGFKYKNIFEYHSWGEEPKTNEPIFTKPGNMYFRVCIQDEDDMYTVLTSVEEATEFIRGKYIHGQTNIGRRFLKCEGRVLNRVILFFRMYWRNNPRAIIRFG
jgi:hypothetical protein